MRFINLSLCSGFPRFCDRRLSEAHWTGTECKIALTLSGPDPVSSLSLPAVELLSEPNGSLVDLLGGDLGQLRVLRTSPLAAVDRNCRAWR